ncbi:MAG: hypothetical protein AAF915_15985 [Cyanobacteria bacterium P01_D01_bin.50]
MKTRPSPLDLLQEESVDVGWVSIPEEVEGVEERDGEMGRWGDGEMGGRVSIQNPKSKIPNRIIQNPSRMRFGGRESTPQTLSKIRRGCVWGEENLHPQL